MFYSFTLYSAVIAAVVPGSVVCEDGAVFVKINPFISKSKKIIQFTGDGRYKRNGPEKSALYLEFPESFFEDPKLKVLYKSLTGADGTGRMRKFDKTDIVFQIDPLGFGEEKIESQIEKRNVRGDDMAAFRVQVIPPIPRLKQMGRGVHAFVPRLETTKLWCFESMAPETELNYYTEDEAVATTQDPLSLTQNYPSKPSSAVMRICGGLTTEDVRAFRQNDPCECQKPKDQEPPKTTPYDLYTACKSQDPIVSHNLDALCFTTERCSPKTTFLPLVKDVFSTTYQQSIKPSCLPSGKACPPTCGSQFYKFFRKRRNKDEVVRTFFSLTGAPQSCPPFCPPCCPMKRSSDCGCTTTCPTTCRTTSHTTCRTTCPCSTTCPTTSRTTTKSCNVCTTGPIPSPPKGCSNDDRAHFEDPLRNVLRLFQRRIPRRVRRNPRSSRRRRRIFVYKPKRGLRKVTFQ